MFPSGGWEWFHPPTYQEGRPLIGSEQRAGWGFQILPYIEAQNVWQAPPVVAVGTPLPVFFCSSRREPQVFLRDDKFEPQIQGGQINYAQCDYAGANRELTGVIRRFKPTKLSEITDGSSHTLLVADKRLNVSRLGRPQDDDNEGYSAGWNEDTIRRTSDPPAPDHTDDGDGEKLFGSSHPSGINMVLVDGSVRFIVYGVSKKVFQALGSIAEGEIVDMEEL